MIDPQLFQNTKPNYAINLIKNIREKVIAKICSIPIIILFFFLVFIESNLFSNFILFENNFVWVHICD